jgi:hypothetical protein
VLLEHVKEGFPGKWFGEDVVHTWVVGPVI